MRNNNQLGQLDALALFSDILQVYNTYLNIKQTSTDTILKELQSQDRDYLTKIVEKQDEIIKRLERIEEKIKWKVQVTKNWGIKLIS